MSGTPPAEPAPSTVVAPGEGEGLQRGDHGPAPIPKFVEPAEKAFQKVLGGARRKKIWYDIGRLALIVGMLGLITAALYPELTTSLSPSVDPLTTSGSTYIVGGNITGLSGLVDGEDIVEGNFSVLVSGTTNSSAGVLFYVFQSGGTERWNATLASGQFIENQTSGPVQKYGLYFVAPWTAWWMFMWYNPNVGTTIHVYYDFVYYATQPPD